jgi:hypothetical protein
MVYIFILRYFGLELITPENIPKTKARLYVASGGRYANISRTLRSIERFLCEQSIFIIGVIL